MITRLLLLCLCCIATIRTASAYDIADIARDLEITDINRNPYLTLADWMKEAPPVPASLPADQAKAFQRSWATLWVNMHAPRGAWTHPIIAPGANYMHGVWLWDSGFHIFGLRHGGAKARQLALWQIEVMLSGQAADGRIPREIHADGPKFLGNYGIQAPGILTKAANDLLVSSRDADERSRVLVALADFYPRFARNHEWYYGVVNQGRGLAKWEGWDSGWDNSPRWDGCFREAVDLNAWLYLDQLELARLADNLGRADEAARWRERSESFKKIFRAALWNETAGVFNDSLCDRKISGLITPAIYFPVWAGLTTEKEAERAFDYLRSPQHFATKYPLPSVAVGDPHFWEEGYWRGPTWANLNWVVYHALKKFGHGAEADALRKSTLELITRTAIPYEYYSAKTGAPLGSKYYGWTSSLFIDLALEPSSSSSF